MRRSLKVGVLPLVLVLSVMLGTQGGVLQVATGSWTPAANLLEARANSTATLLQDGRVLIAGGADANGVPLATAEFFGADGSISPAPSMNFARSRHFALAMPDGRVLAGGGIGSNGMPMYSAEIFDPIANSWTPAQSGMAEARAGAAAALLPDGRVIVSGGDSGSMPSMTFEIFDPFAETFSPAGIMSSPRTKHAMAVLNDGRVMMAGGWNGSQVLQTTDIFDPVTGQLTPGPQMLTARVSHSATTAIDGRVVIAGGNNGKNDLNSVEIFDPSAGTISAGANLATARQGQLAVLLPSNNNILFVGGTSAAAAVASAEMYSPWQGTMTPAGANFVARSAAAASGTGDDGVLLVSGGVDPNGAAISGNELYGFATVKTDASDYAPGTTVTITGSGWKPGETVTLTLVESPNFDTHPAMTEVADANGNFVNTDFSPDAHDLSIRFYLTAVGSSSGWQAQNTFTDGNVNSVSGVVRSSAAGNPPIVGATVSCTGGCGNLPMARTTSGTGGAYVFDSTTTKLSYAGSGAATLTFAATAPGFNQATVLVTIPFSGATVTNQNITMTPIATATTTSLTSPLNPSTFGQSVTFTAKVLATSGVSVPTGSVQFKIDGVASGNPVAVSACAPPVSLTACATMSTSTLNAGNHAIEADFTGTGVFTNSIGTLSGGQNVNPATPTVTVSFAASTMPFDGNSHAATAKVTGVNNTVLGVSDGSVTISYTKNGNAFNGTPKDAAGYAASATFTSSNANYTNASSNSSASLTISAVQLTASIIGNPTKPYDRNTNATLNSANFSLSGLVGGDAFTVTKTGGSYNSKDVTTATTVTATLSAGDFTPSGSTVASNYDLPTTASGPGSITAITLTASIIGDPSKVFDGNTNATLTPANFSLGGLIGSESFTVNQTAGSYNSANVSGANMVTASLTAANFVAGPSTLASNYNLPTSASGAGQITPAATSAAVSSSVNPSAFGQMVSFTATITNTASGATPTGSVQFVVDGANFGSPVAISGSGNATSAAVSLATLNVNGSPHSVKAVYSNNDGNFTGSNGVLAGGQSVNKAANSTAVQSSLNPSLFGQLVTFSATVTNSATGATPTGFVQFIVDGANLGAPVAISGSGNAASATSLAIATLTVAGSPHYVDVQYSNADGNFSNSSGGAGQSVNKASTSTSATTSVSPSALNQSVTFTATVVDSTPMSTGNPTGSVNFYDGGAMLGSGSISGGLATYSTSALAVGSHQITAQYVGDSNFTSSTSAAITQRVQYDWVMVYDPSRAVNGNAAYPIKIYATDANGKDVSSPSIIVHATLVVSGGYSGIPNDAGNSNPNNNFRFDNGFGPSGGYMFNLKTTGLPSGAYVLQFTAGNDPITHAVGFSVK